MKRLFTAALTLMVLAACGGLSNKAKRIAGTYCNTSVSDEVPVFELNRDGTCVMRAIRPDVLTISVRGTWNVIDDTLVIHHDLATVQAEGDTSLVGTVAPEFKAEVVGHSDYSLTLLRDGIEYEYIRHNSAAK
ncbi:hypothetical protein [uncultured Muribaculum sp.]|uniref:hypothetical protein n=1 Tax=uncultured Muribaculum sp. TaxID=1918613 RepID=UPI0025DB2645|nr:hypothetical protein [uncultured Muribaculum sp.]